MGERRARPVRFLSRDGTPRFRFEGAGTAGGRCVRFVDRISTQGLEPGPYSYRFRFQDQAEAIEGSADFEVGAPARSPGP